MACDLLCLRTARILWNCRHEFHWWYCHWHHYVWVFLLHWWVLLNRLFLNLAPIYVVLQLVWRLATLCLVVWPVIVDESLCLHVCVFLPSMPGLILNNSLVECLPCRPTVAASCEYWTLKWQTKSLEQFKRGTLKNRPPVLNITTRLFMSECGC